MLYQRVASAGSDQQSPRSAPPPTNQHTNQTKPNPTETETDRRKLYVAAAKRSVLACVDLAPEFRSLLTTDHLETNMHAVG
jgi:hypothetical protein